MKEVSISLSVEIHFAERGWMTRDKEKAVRTETFKFFATATLFEDNEGCTRFHPEGGGWTNITFRHEFLGWDQIENFVDRWKLKNPNWYSQLWSEFHNRAEKMKHVPAPF